MSNHQNPCLTDDQGRPLALTLTPGDTGDVTVAPALIAAIVIWWIN